jgi:hypothetical protein
MPAADRDRTPSKLRIVALLDRRVESVHVDMDDLANGTVGVGHDDDLLCPTAARGV